MRPAGTGEFLLSAGEQVSEVTRPLLNSENNRTELSSFFFLPIALSYGQNSLKTYSRTSSEHSLIFTDVSFESVASMLDELCNNWRGSKLVNYTEVRCRESITVPSEFHSGVTQISNVRKQWKNSVLTFLRSTLLRHRIHHPFIARKKMKKKKRVTRHSHFSTHVYFDMFLFYVSYQSVMFALSVRYMPTYLCTCKFLLIPLSISAEASNILAAAKFLGGFVGGMSKRLNKC